METSTVVKLFFCGIIEVTSLVMGFLPIFLVAFRRNFLLATVSSCFAGGIFLSVSLIHLLPEGNKQISQLVEGLPLAYILAMSGYSFILLVDKVLLAGPIIEVPKTIEMSGDDIVRDAVSTKAKVSKRLAREEMEALSAKDVPRELLESDLGLTTLVLAIALSVHSVFEGIAVGLQDGVSNVLNVALAVVCHKMAAALAIGINMKDVAKKQSILMIVIFTTATPVGILLGIGLRSIQGLLVEGIFLALCSGSFLYIACSEVIVEEFAVKSHRFSKFFSFLGGFISYTLLNQYISK